jgi:hemolysin III
MATAKFICKVEPNDQGPVYRETDMSRLPVEPWSTASNLIFLAVFIYFALKTKFSYKKFPLLVVFLIILLIGWIGGTVYHATRSHDIWLMLDYMPIMFLVLMSSIYFWREVVGKWILVFTFTLLPIAGYRLLYETLALPHSVSISIGYSVMAFVVVVPLILHCVLKNPKAWKFIFGALASFGIAITFRTLDGHGMIESLTMGTHFLWHIFGGLCCFFMLYYIYDTEKIKLKK